MQINMVNMQRPINIETRPGCHSAIVRAAHVM